MWFQQWLCMFWRNLPLPYSNLKMEAGLFKMLGNFYHTIQCHISKHNKLSLVTAVRTSYLTDSLEMFVTTQETMHMVTKPSDNNLNKHNCMDMAPILDTNHHLRLNSHSVWGERIWLHLQVETGMGKSALVGPLEELVSINVLESSRHYYIIRSVVKNLSSRFWNIKLGLVFILIWLNSIKFWDLRLKSLKVV